MHCRCYPVADRNILRAFEEEPAVASRMRRENGFQIKGSTVGELSVRIVAILFVTEKKIGAKEKYQFQRTEPKINGKLEFNTTIFFESIRNIFI